MAILGGQRGAGPFAFLLQLHFVLQLGCMAARTALNTKKILLSLHGWDCPHRGVSCQLLSSELHLGGKWGLPGAAWGSLGCLSFSLGKCSRGVWGWVGVDVCLWQTADAGVLRFPWSCGSYLWWGTRVPEVACTVGQLGNLATASEPLQPSGTLFYFCYLWLS